MYRLPTSTHIGGWLVIIIGMLTKQSIYKAKTFFGASIQYERLSLSLIVKNSFCAGHSRGKTTRLISLGFCPYIPSFLKAIQLKYDEYIDGF